MSDQIALEFDIRDPGSKFTGKALLAAEDALNGANVSRHYQREVMACFAIENGKPMPRKRLERLFDEMTRDQINATFNYLMGELNKQAVPPQNGKPSETPSKAGEASPDGGAG